MPVRADVAIARVVPSHYDGSGSNYVVQTPTGVLYAVYDDDASDVVFRKSSNGGITWGDPVVVFAGTVVNLSVWYDKWSGLAGGLIHCAYTESGGSDTLYRTIDTASSDALSTQTTIFAGTSAAATGSLSICRARGGNVYCKTMIDAGAEGGFFRLINANVPNGAWDAARTVDETLAASDKMILVPGFAADNQDMLAIFYDNSATEFSRKIYDDSANTWAETSISTGITGLAATSGFPQFAVAVDLTNSRLIVIGWNNVDLVNADLLCWIVTESAITAKTDVVTNSTDDQALASVAIDTNTGYWYAFYCGKTDGSETWRTALNVYYKVSTDAGVTWGAETLLSSFTSGHRFLFCTQNFTGAFIVTHGDSGASTVMKANVQVANARADHQMFGG